ncbi:MAG: hypothetical protein ACM3RX_09530 [Methanococcaceae archaeon]
MFHQSLKQRLLREIIYFENRNLGIAIKSMPGRGDYYIKLKSGKQFRVKHTVIEMLPSMNGIKEITKLQYLNYEIQAITKEALYREQKVVS